MKEKTLAATTPAPAISNKSNRPASLHKKSYSFPEMVNGLRRHQMAVFVDIDGHAEFEKLKKLIAFSFPKNMPGKDFALVKNQVYYRTDRANELQTPWARCTFQEWNEGNVLHLENNAQTQLIPLSKIDQL